MDSYKEIKEESYESLVRYLNLMTQVTNLTNPLAKVEEGDNTYLVTKIEKELTEMNHNYVLCSQRDLTYQLLAVYCDENTLSFIDGHTSYQMDAETGACMEDIKTGKLQQLFYAKSVEKHPKDVYTYLQIDSIQKRSLDLNYLIEKYEDYKMALPYLRERTPDHLTMGERIAGLKKLKKYVLEENTYYRYLRLCQENIVLIPKTGCKIEQMKEQLRSYGFSTMIPRELLQLYRGEHEKANTLKKVIQIYHKNTNL